MDDFILGYLIGAGTAWAGIIVGILVRRRRPKPVELPPGFVPPSAALRPKSSDNITAPKGTRK